MFQEPLPVLYEWEQWVPQEVAGGQTITRFKCHAKKLGLIMQEKEMLRAVLDAPRGGSIRGGQSESDTGKLTIE